MMRHLSLALMLLSPAVEAFSPTDGVTSPDGVTAAVDMPHELRKRNISARGLGCCVFRSGEHSADYQNVPQLDNWAEWMVENGIAGGGYPQKFDSLAARISKDRGMSVPEYVQSTDGDPAILELALRTGRMPCVTYDGRDDFYRGRIAHMVNLVHLDAQRAAILDNNRPGVYVWMTRDEFLNRWRGTGGGWAVVLLAPPPPPIKKG